MKILLTNDDGYNSKGINLLLNKLKKYGEIVIVAPKEHMSAKSVSISLGCGHEVKKVSENIFYMDGTPADCVAFALSNLNIDFDLVVSGCNDGWNVSYDTMYSGTIGACLQALTFRKPTIAISCEHNFEIVDKYFDEVFKYINTHDMISNEYLLNINFPLGDKVKKISVGTLFYRQTVTFYTKEDDGYHAYRNIVEDYSSDKNSDCYQVEHGICSIVPLNKSLFNLSIYDKLVKKEK